MASHSLPVPVPRTRGQSRDRASVRGPSVRVLVAVSVALLILFSWLRVILALEIASTGRQIQLRAQDLDGIERGNDNLRLQISHALSPTRLAPLAEEMGFQPHKPVYVPWPELPAVEEGPDLADQERLRLLIDDDGSAASQDSSLLDAAVNELGVLLGTPEAP